MNFYNIFFIAIFVLLVLNNNNYYYYIHNCDNAVSAHSDVRLF